MIWMAFLDGVNLKKKKRTSLYLTPFSKFQNDEQGPWGREWKCKILEAKLARAILLFFRLPVSCLLVITLNDATCNQAAIVKQEIAGFNNLCEGLVP